MRNTEQTPNTNPYRKKDAQSAISRARNELAAKRSFAAKGAEGRVFPGEWKRR